MSKENAREKIQDLLWLLSAYDSNCKVINKAILASKLNEIIKELED